MKKLWSSTDRVVAESVLCHLVTDISDISGKVQRSVGIRFHYHNEKNVRKECLGITGLQEMDAQSIKKFIS